MTPAIGQAEKIFKTLVWDVEIKAALIYFNIDFWPVNELVTVFTDKIFEGLRLGFDLPLIKFRNAAHENAFNRAAVTLKILERDYGLDSEQYKKAKENAKEALAKFARFGATL